jgi:membrane protease YdiL (CAAX protease family)
MLIILILALNRSDAMPGRIGDGGPTVNKEPYFGNRSRMRPDISDNPVLWCYLMVQRAAQFIGLFVVGSLLAWSFLRTRSIFTPFVLHATFNLGILIKDLIILKNPAFVRRILGYE